MTEPAGERTTIKGDLNAVAGSGGSASVTVHGDVTIHKGPPEKTFSWPQPYGFSHYISERRHGFIGRKWLFNKTRKWYADDDGAQALLVCADFGVGKSAFMAELAADAHGLQIAAYHFCRHYVPATLNPATFVRSVAAQLAASLPAYRTAVESDPDARRWLDNAQLDAASAFDCAILGPLHAISPPGGPRVLLVDALDEALDFERSGSGRPDTIVGLLAGHARQLPAWLRILATSRERQAVLQPIQSAFRCATVDGEDARNRRDIRRYVAGRLAGAKLAAVLKHENGNAIEIATLLSKKSGGKFLYAVRVLNDLESGALLPDRLDALPPGMDGFYLDAFRRRFPVSEDYTSIAVLLGVLCVQREPMSRAELATVLRASEKHVGNMLQLLEDFLRVDDRRYALDHLSVAQWLSEENEKGFPRAGRFSVDPVAAEEIVAAWARREVGADRAHESPYLARHLGAYLSPQERKVEFARLFLNFRWLDARLRAVGVNVLLSDFANLNETLALRALRRALQHAAHVLGREGHDWVGADLLASQILGRLQPSDDTELRVLCAHADARLSSSCGWRPLTGSLRSAEALSRTLKGHAGEISALKVLADGRLASGSGDKTIRLWNLESGVCEATFKGHTDCVSALAVLANGELASASWDKTIRIWSAESGKFEATLRGHKGGINALGVLRDGRLASASSDETIKLWSPASGKCEATLKGHTSTVYSLAVLADGRLVSAAGDATIRLWNPVSLVCEATLDTHAGRIYALALLPDGRIASGALDGTVRVWSISSRVCERILEGHRTAVLALAVLGDGRLASGSLDHMIRVWNLTSGTCDVTLEGHSRLVSALAALDSGRLASGALDASIRLWAPASDMSGAIPIEHTGQVHTLAMLADGRLASGAEDNTIRLWNPATGVCQATLEGHKPVHALAALPDDRLVSAAGNDTIRLWSTATGVCEAPFEEHAESALSIAVLADGRLASGSSDGTIRLWNLASGKCEATLKGHTSAVSALAALADGRLASGSSDGTVRLWNLASGKCEATLKGRTWWVKALAALADGRLASGSSDGTIRLWNLASGKCEATLKGHTGAISALVALGGGLLASGSTDATVRVWHVRNGRWVGSVRFVADAGIRALALADRTGVLAAGDQGGRLHFLRR
ncbi:hypothetical protein A9R05_40400 (plasmid) [Burkholderia sp. KK1]|nr:hypothetical protein A9R05_40400 [Burkholderia sp. KK1]